MIYLNKILAIRRHIGRPDVLQVNQAVQAAAEKVRTWYASLPLWTPVTLGAILWQMIRLVSSLMLNVHLPG